MSRYTTDKKTFYAATVIAIVNGNEIEPVTIEIKENKEDLDIKWITDLYQGYLLGHENVDPFLDITIVTDVKNTPGYRVTIPFSKIDALSVGIEEVDVPKFSPGISTPNW